MNNKIITPAGASVSLVPKPNWLKRSEGFLKS